MEHYTSLSKSDIEAILKQFGIVSFSAFKRLDGGSENSNYFIESDQGQFVLCVCEQKTRDEAIQLANLLTYLRKNDFKTSEVKLTADGESVIDYKGKPIMIRNFIQGKIIEDLSPNLLSLIGKELASLHKIEAPDYLPDKLNYGKEQFHKVDEYAPNSDFDLWLKSVMKYITPHIEKNLPQSLIHGDVFWDNVIISDSKDEVTIMDFEEASRYYRLFDIGMMIIGICAEGEEINMTKAGHLLKGYVSEQILSDEELASLKAFTIYAGAAMTFWRYQNFRISKPNSDMFDHYLGLKVLVDYLGNQEDDCLLRWKMS